ncbi:MAG TPA: glycosyltransferase family A protein [Xanthobacteraceae bacterium]|nr:glycosyltransferase family A protein [Xanthobacteraceae bacterium]
MPKISIIVPNYNHAPYLEMRLRSVFEQSFADTEIILLDDCSTDGSVDILARYRQHPKVTHCLFNQANSGSTFRQWGRGVGCATGDYIWIAESDDVADLQFLAQLSGVLDAHPNVGLAYCQSLKIDAAGGTIGSWKDQTDRIPGNPWRNSFVATGQRMLRDFFLFHNVVPNASAVLWRRNCLVADVLRNAAGYTINGDWYVWSNILLAADLAFVNQNWNCCRFHLQKGSAPNIRNFNNIVEFYRLRGFLYDALGLSDTERRALNAGLFQLWTAQRRSMGLAKNAPETLKVLAAAESVDPTVRARLAAAEM